MERVLASLFFLASYGAYLFLSRRQQVWVTEEIGGHRRGTLMKSGLAIGTLILGFVQFWLLTGVFPASLILLLIGASFVSAILYAFIGAGAGFTLPERRHKIGALSMIWGAQNARMSCLIMVVGLVMLALGVIGSLWAYWSRPPGDPGARVLIALFQFTLPQLIAIPIGIATIWPMITSESLDDDLRNSNLASQFSSIIYRTIYLLFPIWLFQEEISAAIRPLPSVWLLLSVPLLLFLVGGVVPFFIGVNRFQARARMLLEWRWRWLIDVLKLVRLPKGDLRSQGLDEKFRELDEEIGTRLAENNLFQFYRNLMQREAIAGEGAAPSEAPLAGQSMQLAPAGREYTVRSYIRAALDDLKSSYTSDGAADMAPEQRVMGIIRENRKRLVEWDIRFAHVYHLLELYQVALEGKAKNIGGYIETSLQEVERDIASLVNRRNVLAGSLLGIVSAIIVFALNAYQTNIVDFVGRLVGTP